jgi:hypothetical protein
VFRWQSDMQQAVAAGAATDGSHADKKKKAGTHDPPTARVKCLAGGAFRFHSR